MILLNDSKVDGYVPAMLSTPPHLLGTHPTCLVVPERSPPFQVLPRFPWPVDHGFTVADLQPLGSEPCLYRQGDRPELGVTKAAPSRLSNVVA